MIRFCWCEALKLRRSLVLLLCLAAPLAVVAISVMIGLKSKAAVPLDRYWMSGAAFWAFAMLPLAVTALSVLLAQMEHGSRSFDHLLALPGARRWLFPAKLVTMLVLVLAMTALVGAGLAAGALLLEEFRPVRGTLDLAALAALLARMAAAAGLMIVIQLWTALASRSFVPPLLLGIIGTFVSVVAAAAREGAYFPWLMPLHMLSTDPSMQRAALAIGAAGGAAAAALMLVHLGRRELI